MEQGSLGKVTAYESFARPGRGVSQDAVDAAVVRMEQNGFLLDSDFCRRTGSIARSDEDQSLYELHGWYNDVVGNRVREGEDGTDQLWSSPKQLLPIIHEGLQLPPSPVWAKGRVRLEKGERKLDHVALEWIIGHTPEKRVRRGLESLLTLRRIRSSIKYLEKLPLYVGPDGRIHPTCGPSSDDDGRIGAVTGRQAMKNPEGQQIPRDKEKDRYHLRRAFIAGKGKKLVVADYTALEVVIMAHLALVLFDDHQLEESLDPSAPDFHSNNARRIFGGILGWVVPATFKDGTPSGYECPGRRLDDFPVEAFKGENAHPYCYWARDFVKRVWYGLQYGKSAYGFGHSLVGPDGEPIGVEAATPIVEGLHTAVPVIRRIHRFIEEYVDEHNGIPGLDGRWCDLTDGMEYARIDPRKGKWARLRCLRRADNYPMQNGAAAKVNAAMVAIMDNTELNEMQNVMELQVHDEFVNEVPEGCAKRAACIVEMEMENAYPLRCKSRAKAGIGDNWEEAK